MTFIEKVVMWFLIVVTIVLTIEIKICIDKEDIPVDLLTWVKKTIAIESENNEREHLLFTNNKGLGSDDLLQSI